MRGAHFSRRGGRAEVDNGEQRKQIEEQKTQLVPPRGREVQVFSTVVKTTGVVLVIILIFLVVVTGVDTLFAWLLSLITDIQFPFGGA